MKSCCEKLSNFLGSLLLTKVEDETSSSSNEKIAQVASGSIPSSHSMERTNYVVPEAIHGSQSCSDFSKNVRSNSRSNSTDSFSSLRSLSRDEIGNLNISLKKGSIRQQLIKSDPSVYNLYQRKFPDPRSESTSPFLFSQDQHRKLFGNSPYSEGSGSKED